MLPTLESLAPGLLAQGAEGSPAAGASRLLHHGGQAGDELGATGDALDPLVELAQSHPEAVARFLQAVLLLGLVTGLVLPAPCMAILAMTWEASAQCSRPLHLWALVHCGLNLVQAPARLHFYRKLRRRPDAEAVEEVLGSSLWQGCRGLSAIGYAWFVIGVVWVINSDFRGPCAGLSALTLGLVAAALLKPLLTMVAFRRYVPAQLHTVEPFAGAPRGAAQEVIDALACVQFADSGKETSCAVCLVDFEEGEWLRQLPCHHKFHAHCVDRWLLKSNHCPLCMGEVDLSPTAPACSRC